MTTITRLGSKSEDWEEQKRLSKICELQSPDEGQSKKITVRQIISLSCWIWNLFLGERELEEAPIP